MPGKVYGTNQADDEVAVIDIESRLVMRMVPVGVLDNTSAPPEAPHNITLDLQGQYYYINLIVATEIWKFHTLDDAFVVKLSLGSLRSPAQIAITPDVGGICGRYRGCRLTKSREAFRFKSPR